MYEFQFFYEIIIIISVTVAVSIKTFKPDSNVPALQYVGEVDEGGAADCAGLEQGDFMIEVWFKKIKSKLGKKVIPPGIEPGTLSVLDSRDNRYTTESCTQAIGKEQFLYL